MLKDSAALRPMPPMEAEQARRMGDTLRGANAYQTYETLSTLILAALVMTLMVMHTFLAVTAEQLLRRMILAVATMLISREAAEKNSRLCRSLGCLAGAALFILMI